MPEPVITVKMAPSALKLLRLITAATGERQYRVLSRLIAAEAKRLRIQSQDH